VTALWRVAKMQHRRSLISQVKRQSGIGTMLLCLIFLSLKEVKKEIFRRVNMDSYIIVTNNPLVIEHYKDKQIKKVKSYLEVLESVRDYIHLGHKLLTHPLAGSVKPNQNPYRTVLISKEVASLDFNSLSLIENAIEVTTKMIREQDTPNWSEEIRKDFQFVDKSHIDSAMLNI
jgi:hypothetical protein